MIKKLIDKLFSEKITEEKIECAIDDNTVDCKTFDDDQEKAFVGVPAPTENVIDEWFADRSGEVIVKDQEVFAGNYEGPFYAPYTAVDEFKKQSNGDDGMHQKMYDMSTQNGKTTLQLNPNWWFRKTFKAVPKMSIDDWRYSDQKIDCARAST